MSIYFIIYFLIILFIFYIGYIVLKKYNNPSGMYFLLFSFSLGIWYFLYFLTFFTTSDTSLLLIYSKSAYGISIIGLYSFLLFIYFFNIKKELKFTFFNKIILLFFLILFIFYTNNSLIIKGLYFDNIKNDFYEIPGILYNLHFIISIIFIPILFILSYKKFKTLTLINKERLKYILLGLSIFISLSFFFQLILPIFNIRLLEKSTIFFVIPFLFFTFYSVNRYHFIDIQFKIMKIYLYILSLSLTVIIFILIKLTFLSLGLNFINYWGLSNNFNYIDLIFGIILFTSINIFLSKFNLLNNEYKNTIIELTKIKEKIIYITNIYKLNIFLSNEVKNKFKINNVSIKLYNKNDNTKELYKFFNNSINKDFFINDIVFIEENKYKFNKKNIQKELDKNIFLVFPLKNNLGDLIGILNLGKKSFNEQYYSEEIIIIKDFVRFLIGHLKYIQIYSQLNDLNINLDKKIDEKTIEYNTLISKQREFISMSSHEIKTPVTSISLQIENLYDDINEGNIKKDFLFKEIKILKKQIFNLSDLVKNIFTIQKYDIKGIELYIEKIKIKDLIISEYEILTRIYPNIHFYIYISCEIGYINIDKIQFKQVISNLFNNAVKFTNKKTPILKLTMYIKNKDIVITFEDNGNGFKDGEEKNIFNKYSTGNGNSIGIGMGLYLCKKIVELHSGTISVTNSNALGGAKFIIKLPIK